MDPQNINSPISQNNKTEFQVTNATANVNKIKVVLVVLGIWIFIGAAFAVGMYLRKPGTQNGTQANISLVNFLGGKSNNQSAGSGFQVSDTKQSLDVCSLEFAIEATNSVTKEPSTGCPVITVYHKTKLPGSDSLAWVMVLPDQLGTTLKQNEEVRFFVRPVDTSKQYSGAKFRINGGAWLETSTRLGTTSEWVLKYTLSTKGEYKVEAYTVEIGK